MCGGLDGELVSITIKKGKGIVMERKNLSPNHEQIFNCLSCLFEKILTHHGKENVIEFVLHALCEERAFNLSKAAYLVDNHDFDCLKGVAGFDKSNLYQANSVWDEADQFTDHMKRCSFNQQVRNILQSSCHQKAEQDIVKSIAQDLSMDNHAYFSWDVKHDNKALLILEPLSPDHQISKELSRGLYLLGFCPVF